MNSTPLNASATTSGGAKWLGAGDALTRSVARNLSVTGAAGGTPAPDSSIYYESYLVNLGTFSNTTLATRSILTGFGNANVPVQGSYGPAANAPTGLFVGFAQDGTTTYNNNAGNLVIRYNSGNTDADAIVLNGSTGTTTSVANTTYLVVAELMLPPREPLTPSIGGSTRLC